MSHVGGYCDMREAYGMFDRFCGAIIWRGNSSLWQSLHRRDLV
jgi:hypothetical protein